MITVVPSTSPKSPARFYGAPCLPTVKGLLLECDSKDEYLVAREAYEASEGNCNTCVHLVRPPRGHQQLDLAPLDKDHPLGFMGGFCGKLYKHVIFHPEDPSQLECHEQRAKVKK